MDIDADIDIDLPHLSQMLASVDGHLFQELRGRVDVHVGLLQDAYNDEVRVELQMLFEERRVKLLKLIRVVVDARRHHLFFCFLLLLFWCGWKGGRGDGWRVRELEGLETRRRSKGKKNREHPQ